MSPKSVIPFRRGACCCGILSLVLALTGLTARAQEPAQTPPPAGAIRLLVRGDDMGACHSGNAACIKAYREGILRSVEVLTPGPWFLEAAAMLAENPGLDVGVHLALTSEWDFLKWRPLTAAPSLVDADGYFFPNIGERGKPGSGFLGSAKLAEIECELRAQIELARRHLKQITHLSTHMFGPNTDPALRAILEKLSREYDLPLEPGGFQGLGSLGEWPTATGAQKEAAMAGHLERAGAGCWFVLTHPGADDPEMRALHITPWYPNVAADRAGDSQILLSPRIREIIARRGIRLISYADLLREQRPASRP